MPKVGSRIIRTQSEILQGTNKTHGIVGRPSDGRVGLE